MRLLPVLVLLAACGTDDTATPTDHEFCDGVDNDGDGLVDETFNLDKDGFLADEADCRALGVETDCDDLDDAIHPGADERCDGRDNNCNGLVDDGADDDGDGWSACEDCDDDDPDVHPDAAEVCDGIDNDCSGLADEAWDDDGDLVSECGGDCNDRDPSVSPRIQETCDGTDNDCDGDVDEGFDQDADTWTTCQGDCDDAEPLAFPTGVETCDGIDNDCDGVVLEETDPDGDGYTLCDGDCVEGSVAIHPGATDTCNNRDDDCDGVVDTPDCFGCTAQDRYLLCTEKNTWADAVAICEQLGTSLAIVHDEEENAILGPAALILSTSGNAWMGASDVDLEGTWLWVDDTPMDYTSWDTGQPSGGTDDCLVQSADGHEGLWADKRCNSSLPFICEGI